VSDVVRCVDYVLQREDVSQDQLHLIGKGAAALWCIYAAAIDDRIHSTICNQGFVSYKNIVENGRYLYGADIFVPGILRDIDLPEIATAIAPRSLTFVAPVDAMKKKIDSDKVREIYQSTIETYKVLGAEARFRIENSGVNENMTQRLLNTLQAAELHTAEGGTH